jgi:hypothetical protein
MTSIFKLTQGPSREQLFDCLRLGPSHKELRVVDFWAERVRGEGKSGTSMPVEIYGVFRAEDNDDGRAWFFWGRRVVISQADRLRVSEMEFVVGRWNTHFRRGQLVLAEESSFLNPLTAFALLHSNDYDEWNNFDPETEQSILDVCRNNWNPGLADEVCLQQSIPVAGIVDLGDFNSFLRILPNDSYRHKFVVYYLEYLKEKVIGKANCGCVYHAEQGIPCQHDLALLVRPPVAQTEIK